MSSEEASVDVTDFELHALRRARLFPASADVRPRGSLAVSSATGVAVAIGPSSSFVSFATKDVHALKANRDNLNTEVTDLKRRHTAYFQAQAVPICISVNSDGSLFGVLADTPAGPFIHVFDAFAFSPDYTAHIAPLWSVRITADDGAQGTAFEWSPASPDTFATAASDKTVITVQLSLETPGSYKIVKEKKFGAAVRCISWSRKGKQLVVGDAVGKVTQLKPELDIVRSTAAPSTCGIKDAAVTGLCWLTTTEFLVVYGNDSVKDQEATIMITKKDKPITWTTLTDLSYCSAQASGRPAAVSPLSLLDWNVVVLAGARSCEIGIVGKQSENWQVWALDELCRADLPTNSKQAETFPIGADIDLTASEELVLSPDGLKRGRPSPIVLVLSSDGLLVPFHAVTFKHDNASLQLPVNARSISSIRVGSKPADWDQRQAAVQKAIAAAVPAATPVAAVAPPVDPLSALDGVNVCSPDIRSRSRAITAADKMMQPMASTLTSTPAPPAAAPKVDTFSFTPSSTAPPTLSTLPFTPTPPAAAAPPAPSVDTEAARKKTEEANRLEKARKEQSMVAEREKANVALHRLQQKWICLVDEQKRMVEILKVCAPTIAQLQQRLQDSGPGGKTRDLQALQEYMTELQRQEKTVRTLIRAHILKIHDRQTIIENNAGEDGIPRLFDLRSNYDFDRDECMARLTARLAAVREMHAKLVRDFETRQAPKPTGDAHTDRAAQESLMKTMQNLKKLIKFHRERLDELEVLSARAARIIKSDSERDQAAKASRAVDEAVVVIKEKKAEKGARKLVRRDGDVEELRERLARAVLNENLFSLHRPVRTAVIESSLPSAHTSPSRAKTANGTFIGGGNVSSTPVNPAKLALQKSSYVSALSPIGVATSNGSPAVASPRKAALESRLLEITSPRPPVQLPNLARFSIREESRAMPLAQPKASPTTSQKKEFVPLATSTPFPSAATAAAPSLKINPIAEKGAKAASAFTNAKTSIEREGAKLDATKTTLGSDKGASDASFSLPPLVTPTTIPSTSPAFNFSLEKSGEKKAPTPVATGEKPGASASTTTTAAPPTKPKPTTPPPTEAEKATEKKAPTPLIIGGARTPEKTVAAPTTTAAPASTATETKSIFGGGTTATATVTEAKENKSIFGSATALSEAKESKSIFGGSTATAAATDATESPSIFCGALRVVEDTSTTTTTPPKTSEAEKKTGIFGAPATTTPSIFGTPKSPEPEKKTSIFGAPAATPSIFGTPKSTAAPSSIFGAPSTATASPFSSPTPAAATSPFSSPKPPAATSVFGGGAPAQPSSTSFGSVFGGGQGQTAASTFSFKQAAAGSTGASTGSAFGSAFGAPKPTASGSFAAAAAVAASQANADEGMDEGGASGGGGIFGKSTGGGGFMGGLGSTTSANAGKNPFGSAFSGGSTTTQSPSSIFGSPPSSSSIFGAKKDTTSSIFGAPAAAPKSSVFGGGQAATSSAFGGTPAFGSGPSFGSKPVFGSSTAAPQQTAFGSGGGFAAFASGSSSGGFGGAAQQQPQQQSSSIFGGAQTTQKPGGSVFGGGGSSSFNTWR